MNLLKQGLIGRSNSDLLTLLFRGELAIGEANEKQLAAGAIPKLAVRVSIPTRRG